MAWVFHAVSRGRPSSPLPASPLPALAALALLLTGCSSLGLGGNPPPYVPPAQVELPPSRLADPIAAFVAQTAPGQQGVVAPSEGAAPVPVRVVRAYNSAGGRECRELQIGQGMAPRSAIYCKEPAGWVAVRPLLRGGAVARP